jgi:hypothetical protein
VSIHRTINTRYDTCFKKSLKIQNITDESDECLTENSTGVGERGEVKHETTRSLRPLENQVRIQKAGSVHTGDTFLLHFLLKIKLSRVIWPVLNDALEKTFWI